MAILNGKLNLVGPTFESQGEEIKSLLNLITVLTAQNASLINAMNRMENTLRSGKQQQQQQDETKQPKQPKNIPAPANIHQGKGKSNLSTYTNIAGKATEIPFQVVTISEKQKPTPAFTNVRPTVERELVITTGETIPHLTMDNKILLIVNKAMGYHFHFICPKATSKNLIIIEAPTDSDSSAALCFDSESRNGLKKIGIIDTEIKANSKMSKFIVHEIPTDSSKHRGSGCNKLPAQIIANYPRIELAQVFVWKCNADNLSAKHKPA